MPPAGLKRGGARNSAARESLQLSERQCRVLIGRSFDAWDAGQPLNRFVTLAWGKAEIDGCEATKATGSFINRARDWMRWHGHTMPWVWVQERGDVLGQHAHILLHVPPELGDLFRTMPRRWVKSISGGHYIARTLDCQKLSAARAATFNPEPYRAQLLGKLHYMLKCAPAQLEVSLGMEGRGHKAWGHSSRVVGKRAGCWQRQ